MNSLDKLRDRNYIPDANVFIEVEKNKVQKFDSFSEIGTHLFLEKINSANVIFNNSNDQYVYGYERDPKVRKRTLAEIDYLAHIFNVAKVNAVNKEYNRKIVNAKGQLSEYKKIVSDYIDERQDVRPFREMNRIWVDYKGKDGEWYAGFTGIISSIQDLYMTKSNSRITLNCSGMQRLLQITDIILRADIKNALPFDDVFLAAFESEVVYTNRLANLSIQEIFADCLNKINSFLSYRKVFQDIDFNTNENDFFYDVRLFNEDGLENNEFIDYDGISNKRNIEESLEYGAKETVDIVDVAGVKIDKYTDVLIPKLYIDKEILGTKKRIYEKMIKKEFGLLTLNRTNAYAIMRESADMVFLDFFSDSKGNIILQEPKYNVLPNIEEMDNTNNSFYDDKESADLYADESKSYQDLYYYNRLKYHGQNYIIDDYSVRSLSLNSSEASIITFSSTVTGMDFIEIGDQYVEAIVKYGYTSYDENNENTDSLKALQRRYGYRRRDFKSLVINNMDSSSKKMRNAFARLIMNRVNAYRFTGVHGLSWRPDLQTGRSTVLTERQLIAYIIGIDTKYVKGKECNTTLNYAYVHDISDPIDIPWDLLQESDITESKPQTNFLEPII